MIFSRESFSNIRNEIVPLWQLHYEELATDKDEIKLDPNWEQYEKLEELRMLHIVTARENGNLVGYFFFYTGPHLHYKSSFTAWTDIYYLLPEFRKGYAGVRLIKEAVKYAKDLNVQRMYAGTKIHFGPKVKRLFELLGFNETDTVMTKVLR